jgi:hypothetical protein
MYEPVNARADRDSDRLRRLNAVAAVFQTVTGAVLLGITDYDATVPVFTFYPARREETIRWTYAADKLHDFPVGVWSGVFLLLSAADHLWVATCGRAAYEDNLKARCNPARWAEYAVSASIMHVMIAQICGVMDVHLLLAIFALTSTCMLCGWLQELQSGSWAPFVLGFWPWLFQWIIISSYFIDALNHSSPPDFVYAIIVIEIALDSCFALAMWYQQYYPDRYETGEVAFIVLSFTAKQALAWLNFGGTRALPKPPQ